MVSRGLVSVLGAVLSVGCSLLNASDTHTRAYGLDAGTDAAPAAPPTLRVAHLARDTSAVDVYANGVAVSEGLEFSSVRPGGEVAEGDVLFRVVRASTEDVLAEQTFTTVPGRAYTLTLYGDEVDPPFTPPRTLALLLLDDDASGIDGTREIRLAAVHVASPVVAGQLVAVMPGGNVLLANDFQFAAVARLPDLPSMGYTVGFDAMADGTIDVDFDLPALVPGTYANVFVASRSDDSVFLLVSTNGGAAAVIEAN